MTIVLPWNSAVLHWQLQPCWSALSKNVIWSFVFRSTAVFSCLFSCGEFGRDPCKAFCQDRAGSLLCVILRGMCSQSSLRLTFRQPLGVIQTPPRLLSPWMTLLALLPIQGIIPIVPTGFLRCSAEPAPANSYGRTLLGVKKWWAPPLFIVCITQAPKIYKVYSPEEIAGF